MTSTVRRALRRDGLRVYRRPPRPSRLDPFRNETNAQMGAFSNGLDTFGPTISDPPRDGAYAAGQYITLCATRTRDFDILQRPRVGG
jgi:hypothetical protein